ncbi:MAG: roadblock/LC7 domain-containing protein [Candidatus Sericytochromatia bacterium]
MSNQDLLNKIKQISGVKGALVASKDGLVQDSSISDDTDPNVIGTVISYIFNNIQTQSKRMQRGEPKRVILETDSQVISVLEYAGDSGSVLVFGEYGKDIDLEGLNNTINQNF